MAINWSEAIESEGSVIGVARKLGIPEMTAHKLINPRRYGYYGKLFDLREPIAEVVGKYFGVSARQVRNHYLRMWEEGL